MPLYAPGGGRPRVAVHGLPACAQFSACARNSNHPPLAGYVMLGSIEGIICIAFIGIVMIVLKALKTRESVHKGRELEYESRKRNKKQEIDRASNLLQDGGLANLQEVLRIYSEYVRDGYDVNGVKKEVAREKEKMLDYAGAIEGFEELGLHKDAKRVRRKVLDEKKVNQTVVHGDYVDDRDTIVKDSVISRSNIGAGGDDKFAKLKELKKMLSEGLIDDDEFKQMKKEILGK